MYQCPVEYEPEKRYTRREMIELIRAQRQLLCFFAQMSGCKRCVLGLEFEHYEPASGMVPLYVMGDEEAKVMGRVEGRKFKRAYQSSGVGKAIVVTPSTGSGQASPVRMGGAGSN